MIYHYLEYLFVTTTIIQCLFYSLWWINVVNVNNKQEPFHKGISVIICAHNEANNLPALLDALKQQVFHQFEVLIVNDRSTDHSKKILDEYHWSQLRVIHIHETPPNWDHKKYALKKGIESAAYEHILLTDADCLPATSNWIKTMASGFNQGSLVVGVSPYNSSKSILNALIQHETILTLLQYIGLGRLNQVYMGVGRNMAYTKDFFWSEEPWRGHQNQVGGDDDLLISARSPQAKNTAFKVCFDSQTRSIPKNTLKAWLRQKTRHLSVGVNYPFRITLLLGLFIISQISWHSLLISFVFLTFWSKLVFMSIVLRTLLIFITFGSVTRKLRIKSILSTLLLTDIFISLYFLIIGVKTLLVSNRKWN